MHESLPPTSEACSILKVMYIHPEIGEEKEKGSSLVIWEYGRSRLVLDFPKPSKSKLGPELSNIFFPKCEIPK